MKPRLHLLMGLPGAGKTTAAKIIENLTGATRLSSDEERLKLWPKPTFSEAEHQQLYDYLNQKTKTLLLEGKSVIYDANLNRYEHRQEKYDLTQSLDVNCMLYWVQTPHNTAKQRRVEENLVHYVPRSDNSPADMFERISRVIEPPEKSETYVSLDGTKITPEYIAAILSSHEIN